ncbi:DUF502 domain-containing protein [Chelatococcus reniformis]|uniref:Membrane protein n=1 Tax=Chelatococcus reniformis TaxID=1494448 RepID=A0A916U0F6_9HYPH|nr:DUF502 domain-containing protein [Chelatococcus reniformis]GGC55531.1 membrane protein [Chelatococcus reniformis]
MSSKTDPPNPEPAGLPPPDAVATHGQRGISARARIRNYFLTGLIVAGPLALTIYITWWIVGLVDAWVKPLVPAAYWPDTYLPVSIPGFGLIVAFVGLTLLGFLTANLVGRSLVEAGETLLERMPVVSGLYRGIKQIFETAFSPSGTTFRRVGLVQFPTPGTWSIVFIAAAPPRDMAEALPPVGEYVGVFLPCTPNPTTGFFFYLPRRDVLDVPVSVDDAAKLVMSAGLIQPEDQQKRLQALAAQAREPA